LNLLLLLFSSSYFYDVNLHILQLIVLLFVKGRKYNFFFFQFFSRSSSFILLALFSDLKTKLKAYHNFNLKILRSYHIFLDFIFLILPFRFSDLILFVSFFDIDNGEESYLADFFILTISFYSSVL
ncbi:hypothetical protein LINGRAHAP2_LOCUS34438, partial [Linum grandiflorum]